MVTFAWLASSWSTVSRCRLWDYGHTRAHCSPSTSTLQWGESNVILIGRRGHDALEVDTQLILSHSHGLEFWSVESKEDAIRFAMLDKCVIRAYRNCSWAGLLKETTMNAAVYLRDSGLPRLPHPGHRVHRPVLRRSVCCRFVLGACGYVPAPAVPHCNHSFLTSVAMGTNIG